MQTALQALAEAEAAGGASERLQLNTPEPAADAAAVPMSAIGCHSDPSLFRPLAELARAHGGSVQIIELKASADEALSVGGGSGGHNGIKSLDSTVGNMYGRIRIGVDKPDDADMVADYVLSNFTNSERKAIDQKIELITNNIELLITGKVEEFTRNLK